MVLVPATTRISDRVDCNHHVPKAEAAMSSALASSDLLYFTERGSGPPLLLVHGLMVTGEMFEPVIEHFATRHRVIVPDLRGHGRSRGLPPPYTAAQLASDLSRLLDHLGIDSTAVLGYSQGGAIAQQLVLDHPKRCDRLVLACTYAFNMATFRERLEGHLVPLLVHVLGMRRFAKFVVSQGVKELGKERADWIAGLIARPGPQVDGARLEGGDGVRQQAPPGRDQMSDARRRRLERSRYRSTTRRCSTTASLVLSSS